MREELKALLADYVNIIGYVDAVDPEEVDVVKAARAALAAEGEGEQVPLLCELYGAAYQAGHNDTVEACFRDVGRHFMEHEDVVKDWLEERRITERVEEGGE